jgi:hypothetical protein
MGLPQDWSKFARHKIRTCRTLHRCGLCHEHIVQGERYHDGGYDRRAHVDCVELGRMKAGPK